MKDNIINHAWGFGYGGMSKEELSIIYDICDGKDVLELGSYMGQSSFVIGTVAKTLTCVDAWNDEYDHLEHDQLQKTTYLSHNLSNIFDKFKLNCSEGIVSGKIQYKRGLTSDLYSDFEDHIFDVVIIDADHSEEGCLADIENYMSKVRAGGDLVFHDYNDGYWAGVTNACNFMVAAGKIYFKSNTLRIGIFGVV